MLSFQRSKRKTKKKCKRNGKKRIKVSEAVEGSVNVEEKQTKHVFDESC
jgi:hypothetical protein